MSQISSSNAASTLTAMFDSRNDAEDAVRRLVDAGVPESSVRLVPGYENDEAVDTSRVHKGFFESLADFFMPEEDRYTYAEGLSRGSYMVTVSNLSASLHETALDILDDEGAINLDEREEAWKSEGWSGYTTDSSLSDTTDEFSSTSTQSYASTGDTQSYASTGTSGSLGSSSTSSLGSGSTDWQARGTDEVIPVVEEELKVGKRDVNLGRVRVRSYVTETPVNAAVNLREETVHLERRPVDRALTGNEALFQDRTIEAEAHAEEAIVSKEARVTEEISLRKESTERQETISDTVRKTEVEVEDDRDIATTRDTSTGTFNR